MDRLDLPKETIKVLHRHPKNSIPLCSGTHSIGFPVTAATAIDSLGVVWLALQDLGLFLERASFDVGFQILPRYGTTQRRKTVGQAKGNSVNEWKWDDQGWTNWDGSIGQGIRRASAVVS